MFVDFIYISRYSYGMINFFYIILSTTKNHTVKNYRNFYAHFFEILPKIFSNQNYVGCAFTPCRPSSYTTESACIQGRIGSWPGPLWIPLQLVQTSFLLRWNLNICH